MKVQDRQDGPSKSFRAYQKKLAGYAPEHMLANKVGYLKNPLLASGEAIILISYIFCLLSLYVCKTFKTEIYENYLPSNFRTSCVSAHPAIWRHWREKALIASRNETSPSADKYFCIILVSALIMTNKTAET